MYIKRSIESQLLDFLQIFPVLGITGPRQSGKSTLLQHLLHEYSYISFDDIQIRQFYYNDPKGFFIKYNNKIIFDEVQKVPELFEHIKILVDQDRSNYGRFILTGSSQFTLIKKITESLAGRIGLLSLLPFSYQELPKDNNFDKLASIWQGSYPELVVRKYSGVSPWFSSYITTYIERDVRDLLQIGDLRDFQRLIELLAANTSQVLNMSTYARDLGVTVQTIKRWISILEASYIIFLLPPYFNNYGKRIVKSPKVYFWDTGIVSFITGISTEELLIKGPMAGALFENYIIADVYKKILHHVKNHKLYYLRTSDGQEIDLIIDKKISQEFIEIKFSATPNYKMSLTLNKYSNSDNNKFIIYQGETTEISGVKFINFSQYLDINIA